MLKLIELAVRKDFSLGPLQVSPSVRLITGPKGEVHVEPLIMQVFLLLADAKGQVVTRNQLYDECWGGVNVGDYSLNRAVTMVRRIAAETAPGAFEIKNIPRTGYRMLVASSPAARGERILQRRRWLIVSGAVLTLVGVAAGIAFFGGRGTPAAPAVALIADRDNPVAVELADGIAAAAVNPTTSDNRFTITDAGNIGSPDFMLRIDAAQAGQAGAKLTLLSAPDNSILWTWSPGQTPRRTGPVEAGTVTAAVLGCAVETRVARGDVPDQATVKLYLDSCARFEPFLGAELQLLGHAFEQVVARAPQLRGAWSRLFLSKAEMIEVGFPPPELVAGLRRDLQASRRLHIEIPETYIAEAAVLPLNARFRRLELYEAGLARYPTNLSLLAARSWQLRSVGRLHEAALTSRRLVQLAPTSPAASTEYAQVLMNLGQVEGARSVLDRAALVAPNATNLKYARWRLEMRYGDPRAALAMLRSGEAIASPHLLSFLNARLAPTKVNVDRAIADQLAAYQADHRDPGPAAQALGAFGKTDEAIQLLMAYRYPKESGDIAEILFRPPLSQVRRDPRFMQIARRLEVSDYWVRSGNWPDFCFEPGLPYDCRAEAAKARS